MSDEAESKRPKLHHPPESVLNRLQNFINNDEKILKQANGKSKKRQQLDRKAIVEDVDEEAEEVGIQEADGNRHVELVAQSDDIVSRYFPTNSNFNRMDIGSIGGKLRKLHTTSNIEIFGKLSMASDNALSHDDNDQKIQIIPCQNLSELAIVYGVKCPRIWKQTANATLSFDSNYSRYISSCLSTYADLFIENSIPAEVPGNRIDLATPILLHLLVHTVNMRVQQVRNNTKKKALLLQEETAAAVEASLNVDKDSKRKDTKKFNRQHKLELSEQIKAAASKTSSNSSLTAGDANISHEDDHFHDAGFTRPRVLILCPFRHSAMALVDSMIQLLNNQQPGVDNSAGGVGSTIVSNYDKLVDEFSFIDEDEEEGVSANSDKPLDWQRNFHNLNIDDDFKIGIQINPGQGRPIGVDEEDEASGKKSVSQKNKGVGFRLFTEFYSSDIIIASPLGLRFVLENPVTKNSTDKHKGLSVASDFLSSIESIYLHDADVLHMQNWEHVEFILKHTNQLPALNSTQIDYGRIRPYFLNQEGKYHRQLIVSAAFNDASIQSTFRHYNTSMAGTIRLRVNSLSNRMSSKLTQIKQDGYISQVVVPVKQIFQQIPCNSFADQEDARFEYFKEHILTPILRSNQPHTLIVAPSYLHYVRIRNELLKREANAAFVCEYSRDSEISRGRSRFVHGQNSILLYSGRAHFFRRFKIRGALNLVFYSLPEYPHFYSEFINNLESSEQVAASITLRKRKEVFESDIDPTASNNSYTTVTEAMKKKAKKRAREQENERAAAALRQSSYSAEEIRAMENSCIVLFTNYDKLLLGPIVGGKRSDHMLNSGKSTFMFH